MTPEEAIGRADEIDAETRYRHQLAAETGARASADGYDRGYSDGYLRAIADLKAAQQGIVSDAQLEETRWGPGGREHFAAPRPGDFPGREPEAAA